MIHLPITGIVNSQALADCITTDLAHWWSMNEVSGNRADSHGSLTLIDNDSVASSTLAVRTRSALFASDYFTADLTGSPIDNQGSFSGWLWLWLTQTPSSQGRSFCLLAKSEAGDTGLSWEVGVSQTSNRLYMTVKGPVLDQTVTRFFSFVINTSYYIYFYYDAAAGEIGVSFNNGTITKNTFGGSDLMHDYDELNVGRRNSTTTNYLAGYMDEVGLWSRVLDADEVEFLYSSGGATGYPELAWECDPSLIEQILWGGPTIVSNVVEPDSSAYSGLYFHEGSNATGTDVPEPYDSTCVYYSAVDEDNWVKVISDRYPYSNNNVPFDFEEFVVKFEYVSGSTDVHLDGELGRDGEWWEIFRTQIAIWQLVVGSVSAIIDVTVAVWDGTGDPSIGTAGAEPGTEVTRRVSLRAQRLA